MEQKMTPTPTVKQKISKHFWLILEKKSIVFIKVPLFFLNFLGDVKYSNTNNDYNDKDDVYVSNKWWKQQGFQVLLAQEQNQC